MPNDQTCTGITGIAFLDWRYFLFTFVLNVSWKIALQNSFRIYYWCDALIIFTEERDHKLFLAS
jgi:hypothetical protein